MSLLFHILLSRIGNKTTIGIELTEDVLSSLMKYPRIV